MIAELYFFSAVTFSKIEQMEEVVYKVLFKEVFQDQEIRLPYEPKEGETLNETLKRYREKD